MRTSASTFDDQLVALLPSLRRFAFHLTHDPTEARELVQDTVARAMLKRHLWRRGTNLRAWLFTLMKNQSINNLRSIARRGISVEVGKIDLPTTDDPQIGLMVRDLRAAVARLPLEQRRVLALVCYRGMSYVEAAAATGTPIGTVRSRLSRARDELRAMMGR